MFAAIKSIPLINGGTRATLELQEMGLLCRVEFYPRASDRGHVSAQVLSRVLAINPNRMAGLPVPHTWATCMRYNVVAMYQHLPIPKPIDCYSN